ncbi:hypothetical protein PGT21_016055 [Puccinia graminis f. sp. tritici]|uniref:Sec39 domain-containing protein n=1 Tax=Puccinia graminis f. sp. tritici TaxID=56615 RepID=A0A5B0NPT0_PUCGR|nr:hypothetical protein PGTUg99_022812 [Puccinia graminis f. sp. tritici]KAA1090863.1 hypothetical protein PGT21_016055 [Puccinia graminis f. sp. tritici]
MEESLGEAIDRQDWSTAAGLATSLDIEPAYISKHRLIQQLSSAEQSTIDLSLLETVLETDPPWAARLIINFLNKPLPSTSTSSYSYPQENQLIKLLNESIDRWLDQLSSASHLDFSLKQVLTESVEDLEDELKPKRIEDLIKGNQEIAEACSAKWFSIQAELKWKIYNELYQPEKSYQDNKHESTEDETEETDNWGGLELDPLEDLDEAVDQLESNPSFLSFLQSDLDDLALLFASQLQLGRLRRLLESQQISLNSTILFDSIPLHARPSDLDYGQELIALLPRPIIKSKPSTSSKNVITTIFSPAQQQSLSSELTEQQLTDWYLLRVKAIDRFTGCIDTAIEIIQHGAASGVPGLELLAEDLSLLAKLLYDAPYSSAEYDWTLEEWSSKSPDEIVKAYLAGSSPSSLIKDIHRLVLPYLGVLESRRARASVPGAESTIPDSLRTWALSQSNHLPLLEALIKASPPTMKLPERPIKSNEDLARILVACLYTSSSLDEWECMGRMFECMPAFPDNIPSSDEFNSADYLHGLFTSSTGSTMWSLEGTTLVYNALRQLDNGRLSSILDGLDDHLTTAEVLARWNVPARLADLVLKFHGNKIAQQKLATKIARQEGGIEMESEEEWEVLLEAMIELSQPGRALDLLDKQEITKLFFSGLLTSGKFKLAKSLFSSTSDGPLLEASTQEELVIAASREFYDNAESGNLHTREMKMAYDCLTVVPQTLNIKRERDFIEATSRLASFKIESQAGVLMSPIEFRLKPNKLDLIAKVLDVSRTAYQHQEMIIDLVNKLGYGEDSLVQIKALSMVVQAALGEGSLPVGSETCERMISILERMKKRSRQDDQMGSSSSRVDEASEVVWKTCEGIGRYDGYGANQPSLKGFKAKFMAHAIIICPAEQIPRLLIACKETEAKEELVETRESSGLDRSTRSDSMARGGSLWNSIELEKSMSESNVISGGGGGTNLGLPGGDLASRTLERAASLFPFKSKTLPPQGGFRSTLHESPPRMTLSNSLGANQSDLRSSSSHTPNPANPSHTSQPDFSLPLNNLVDQNSDHPLGFGVGVGTDRLTTALSNKFTSGVGWLIGANEDESS